MVHRNVDDAPPTPLDHVSSHGAGHQKRPIDIGIDNQAPHGRIGLPELGGSVEEFFAHETHSPAGVVYQNIYRSKIADGFAHHAFAVFLAGDVGGKLADAIPVAGFRGLLGPPAHFLAAPPPPHW